MIALAQYGHISCWGVSQVTNMRSLFNFQLSFNEGISHWEVEDVQDMGWMFNGAEDFNQDLSDWAVSVDNNTYAMFDGTIFSTSLVRKPH